MGELQPLRQYLGNDFAQEHNSGGRDQNAGQALEAEIISEGGRALFYPCEVTDFNQINQTAETFSPLDILINNAGTVGVKMLNEYTEQEWDSLMDLNVKSLFMAFKFAFPHLASNAQSYEDRQLRSIYQKELKRDLLHA